MMKLRFWKEDPINRPDLTWAELVLRDKDQTTAATVAVIAKKGRIWEVGMVPPTKGAGFDADVFERPTLKAAKAEIAARLFIAIVGCRDGDSVKSHLVRRIA